MGEISLKRSKEGEPLKKNLKIEENEELVVTKQGIKPRYSDAILSCPCCLTIVCMDCQRHEKFENQYRAMFVMNIVVDWSRTLVYNEVKQSLQPRSVILAVADEQNDREVYYDVQCGNCGTRVAALNMSDEVYHFY